MQSNNPRALMPSRAQAKAITKGLRYAGLRSTKQRVALAHLLFQHGNRHVTAEVLYGEAKEIGLAVSQATIYNTLNQFRDAGLLREVIISAARSYFDTNLSDHHHFYIEEEAKLIDIDHDALDLSTLPTCPQGFDVDGVNVVVRLSRRA